MGSPPHAATRAPPCRQLRHFQFLMWLIQAPRTQKYLLGDRVHTTGLDVPIRATESAISLMQTEDRKAAHANPSIAPAQHAYHDEGGSGDERPHRHRQALQVTPMTRSHMAS